MSELALRLLGVGLVVIVVGVSLIGLLYVLPWDLILPRVILLAVLVGLVYWTTTLLPGPIKKLTHAAGKAAWHTVTHRRKHG